MKKIILCSTFVASLAFANEAVLLQKDDIKVTKDEVISEISYRSPTFKHQLKLDPSSIGNVINDIYSNRLVYIDKKSEVEAYNNFDKLKQINEEKFIANLYFIHNLFEKYQNTDFEELARQEYLATQESYKSPTSYDIYHILFLKDSNLSDKKGKDLADELLSDIKSEKISIEEASKKYHMSISGGDESGILEGVTIPQLEKSIGEALDKLEVGQVSDVIESNIGYHIIANKAEYEGEIPSFEKVKNKLIEQARNKYLRVYLADLKKDYESSEGVQFNEDIINGLIEEISKEEILIK